MNIRQYILERSTAIARVHPSAPARKLIYMGVIKKPVLDFGAGRGKDADTFHWDKYDPEFFPNKPSKKYKTIICTYVLNTLPKKEERKVLANIRKYLKKDGIAYITVRTDNFEPGETSQGTFQRKVNLKMPVLFKNSSYKIYQMKKGYFPEYLDLK